MVGHTRAQKLLKTIGFYGLVTFFMLPTVFVFYWMVTLSLKPQIEAAAYPPIFFNFSINITKISYSARSICFRSILCS